jgi:hypothetical protein
MTNTRGSDDTMSAPPANPATTPVAVRRDATLVLLQAERRIDANAEFGRRAVILVLAGDGTLDTGSRCHLLTPGDLLWLSHGLSGEVSAGRRGLAYLAVPRRGRCCRTRRGPPDADQSRP